MIRVLVNLPSTMKALRLILRISVVFFCTAVFSGVSCFAQSPVKIAIKSYNPQDYAEIFNERFRQLPVDIFGYLAVPASQGKVPAVVIIPGSGGYQQWMQDTFAKRLNEIGIATLIVDSFTGRDVKETATNQAAVSMAASVVDGFAALQALAQRPEIDASKIGITGFSRGGVVSMFSQDRRLANSIVGQNLQFAAHLPFYPGCTTTFDNPAPTSAPSLFLLGEKDDYTPAAQCTSYIERLKSAGAQADFKIYPGAYHGWISDVSRVAYVAQLQVFANCDLRINDVGIIREVGSGATSAEGWGAFVAKTWKHCGKSGAHYGSIDAAKKESLNDMVVFFTSHLTK